MVNMSKIFHKRIYIKSVKSKKYNHKSTDRLQPLNSKYYIMSWLHTHNFKYKYILNQCQVTESRESWTLSKCWVLR